MSEAQAPAAGVPAAGGPTWRAPPEPRAVLRAAGLADEDAAAAAVLQDRSRSHAVTCATLPGGRAWVVKRLSAEAHAGGRSLAAELYAYRLAAWRPALAAVLPTAAFLDERRQVLVLAAAPEEQLYPARCFEPGFPGAALAAALGRSLGRLHAATTGVPLLTVAACGVLALPDAPEAERNLGAPGSAAATVGREVAGDAVLAAALRRTALALRPSCLLHADVKWDNAVLDDGPPATVLLFDLELSGRGDPAWDVGCALADTAALPLRLRGLGALPATATAFLDGALGALLAAYAAEAPPAHNVGAFAQRVAGCWTGRTVHLALECAAAAEDARAPVVRDLLVAARRLDEITGDLAAAVEAGLRSA